MINTNISTTVIPFKHRLNGSVAASFSVSVLLLSPLNFVADISSVYLTIGKESVFVSILRLPSFT